MITFQIPTNGVVVFLNFEGAYTKTDQDNNKEAVFRVSVKDDEFIMRGDNRDIQEAAAGLCHVFNVQVNEDPSMPNDFIGLIQCGEGMKFPKGVVRLSDVAEKGKMHSRVYLQIGERSMSFGTASKESAQNYAKGLAEFLGLVKKRKGEEYTGSLKFA